MADEPKREMFRGREIKESLKAGTLEDNPVCHQCLGICSALAVTGMVRNTLVMCAALFFVLVLSNVTISMLRNTIPRKVRIIAEMAIISTLVILFEQFLKAFHYEISKQLGPYVGLIITNCIILGRAEACALTSSVVKSFWDGVSNATGYSLVLIGVSLVREALGRGTIFGVTVMPEIFAPCQVMLQAAGAFFVLGAILWVIKSVAPDKV